MGRTAKSAETKIASGNPGKRKVREAINVGTAPEGAPAWLTNVAAGKVWKALHDDLVNARLLRSTDVNVLGRYCQYMAFWIGTKDRLARKKNTLSYLTDTKHGKMRRIDPDFLVMDRLESNLVALEAQIGLTPRARQSVLAQMAAALNPPPPGGRPPQPDAPAGEPGDDADDEPALPLGDAATIGALSRPH